MDTAELSEDTDLTPAGALLAAEEPVLGEN
jgi:hypothetical protein